MHILVLLLLLTTLCPFGAAFAAEGASPQEPVAQEPTMAIEENPEDSLGLGAVGYGSPVRSEHITSGEVFGGRTGYVHPFLSVGGFYTDNLFRTPDNEKSDWVTVISPGIWFSLPASHQKLLEINMLNTAPGGLAVSRFRTESEQRFQGYALYRADIRNNDKYTDEDRTDHRGEGLFKISLRGGLSLELVDVYEVNQDPYGTGGTTDRKMDQYKANLFNAVLAWDVSPKLMLRADYGNYSLDYDAARNDYRNRTDNSYSLYVFYQATPKTALFLQGELIQIDYDQDSGDDSDEKNYYLGIEMKVTAKTRALIKAGYGDKEFDQASHFDRDDFLFEGQVEYAFTPKTSIYLRGLQRVLETDEVGSHSILSRRAQLGYRQRIYSKLRAEAALFWLRNEYDGTTTIGTQSGERDDDEYGGVIAVGYSPVRWGSITLGYEYRERDSNFDTEDYQADTVFVRLAVAM